MEKPVVGQEVVVCQSGNWDTRYFFGYCVAKVSPKGNITVTRKNDPQIKRVFNADGHERSTSHSKWNRPWLELDVQKIRSEVDKRHRVEDAVAALSKVRVLDNNNVRWSKEELLEKVARLEALLEEAKKKINEI